jgi:acetoacetyl-CoA synthetase
MGSALVADQRVTRPARHDAPLWTAPPDVLTSSRMGGFTRLLENASGDRFADYRTLHRFSIEHPERFWSALWDFCGVRGERGERIVLDLDRIPGARFFPDARLNFAENLLRRDDDAEAIVFWSEAGERSRLSWAELCREVSKTQRALADLGIVAGDRIAAVVPNTPESVICALAAASLGAIWSSCSPDFGERAVLDRFGQIEPRVVIGCDGYQYNGKRISIADRMAGVVEGLPTVTSVLLLDCLGEAYELAQRLPNARTLADALAEYPGAQVRYQPLPFDHPLYILYSSGTTGIPKAIVHSAGGTLLQHLKEHQLHCDVRRGDRVFYYTTCGWMMWNWLVSALASEATLLLYDGSPAVPSLDILFELAETERMTLFGTSAKFIDAVRKSGIRPRERWDLSSVRLITSTGSPLAPDAFDFVYDAIAPDAQLASISGGTDIVSCFVLGNPTEAVWRGEIQGPGLGMAVDVWDEDGRPLPRGTGELVCTRPFPSMPIGFWNDPGDRRYRAAYFERFPGVWHHGDFAEWTEHGGIIIHGRSDATLNPGGVRIGTAEIYAQVEAINEILEALAIGQEWGDDVRVVLFVRLADGVVLDDALRRRITRRIREGASPRHVPARIIAVDDIPRTKSGKITEIAVRDIVAGRKVHNCEALANPEALELFRDLPELAIRRAADGANEAEGENTASLDL